MFINITRSETGNNKGSSGQLVHYLDKENRLFNQEPELWFNGEGDDIRSYKVKHALDNNISKLCRDDAKFFLINISPSQKEIAFLKEEFGEENMKVAIKDYAASVMDEYAKNFNRSGINSGDDLLWFGKLESHRYYSHTDAEVKNGERKRGEPKSGEQMHVQVIVSRKDKSNSIKLSPMNNSKGRNAEHSKKLGQFNRVAFKQSGEILFDRVFGFERGLKETLAYSNIQKNGTPIQKEQLKVLQLVMPQNDRSTQIRLELARDLAEGSFNSVSDMLKDTGKTIEGFLQMMLEPAHSVEMHNPVELAKRRRRKQQQEESHGLSR